MRKSIALLALAGPAFALRGPAPIGMGRRNPGGVVVDRHNYKRQAAPTNEATGAESTDPTYECTGYSYAPVTALISSYPEVWETASIMSDDTEAMAIFQTINAIVNAKLPNDLPHGTPQGDFKGVAYNSSDPDCWWSWDQCDTPAASTGLPADITTVPEPMTWALGFDDGPNCSHNALYDYLQQNNQKATMFYIGSNVMDWSLQALRGIDDGHQICVHTWSHQYMTAFSNENAFAELYYARKIIKDLLGVTPLCWRPPYGDVDNRIRMIAQGLNLTTIVWDYDTQDWREGANDGVTAQDVTDNYMSVINAAKNGTYDTHGPVVLNHELSEIRLNKLTVANFTMGEFMQMYPSIKSAFKYVVPLCTAMNLTHPYAEQNVTCPTFDEYTNQASSSGSSTNTASSSTTGSAAVAAQVSASATTSATAKSDAERSAVGLLEVVMALAATAWGISAL